MDTISEWESKILSNETFLFPYIANVSACPKLVWRNNSRIRLKFKERGLKQLDKAAITSNSLVNLFTVYQLDTCSRDLKTDFILKDCLFGSVNLTKDADPCKYKYSGYSIRFKVFITWR